MSGRLYAVPPEFAYAAGSPWGGSGEGGWTVSDTPGVPGWETDGGRLDYGLPESVARQIAAASVEAAPVTSAVSMSAERREMLRPVRLLLLDFDGVMTDNHVLVSEDGTESVWCHRGDGLGIARLREAGVGVAVISAEANPVVCQRCSKLGVACHSGVRDKGREVYIKRRLVRLLPEECAFVGNDTNDLSAFDEVGVRIAVADAHPEVLARAHLVTQARGGHGAVREVCDWILEARG